MKPVMLVGLAVSDALAKLTNRYGADEVVTEVKRWVEYIESVKAIQIGSEGET